ncbi:poly [ADP-ribose] polymerase 1-like [Haliotis rufescens]|uniref:poly [ADP-ribose] polymerase 1-like n=1 Tax=Haliotis rufescens TaxID=6454 RepID=UPI00201E75B3|nr:poly [ADP-ribose] polymerase 1-like [Haliotis rufescens]
MADHHDLPFKAEYAKSGRASCKGCKGSISQDSLRLAIMIQSPHFDGKVPNWFHYACFWKRSKVQNPDDIHGFHSLRWEDQQKIKDKVGGGAGDAGDNVVPGSGYNDFTTEYAKSGRSTCRGCDSKIEKDAVRISKKDYTSERAKMYGPQDLWYHSECFKENREDLDFGPDLNVEKILGFGKLKKEDKDELIELIGKGDPKAQKRKAEEIKEKNKKKAKKEDTEEEKKLKEQSQLIWSARDQLSKNVSNEAIRLLLELNNQKIPSGESKLMDAVADVMTFGSLEPCTECSGGQLVYTSEGYKCTGNMTEWTKCMNITKTPTRKPFKVPKEFHDVDFLKKYKYVKRVRVFPTVTVSSTEGPVSSSMDAVDGSSASSSGLTQSLENMRFVIAGKTSKSKAALSKEISSMGGTVVSKVDKTVAAVISTKDEVTKKSKNIKDAEKSDVHVIAESFLEDVKKGGAALMIQKHSIATWGADPVDRIVEPQKQVKKSAAKSGMSARDEAMYTKSVPAKLKMKVKGGAAVDPDSGLEDTAHVIDEKGDVFSAVLGLVDIVRGTNSFYKIQALEGDKGSRWWIFRAWGRVGTTIGGNKLEKCGSRNKAIESFKALYGEKTNNNFDDRKNFQKFPNKFYPLDIDYGQDEDAVKSIDRSSSKSKLPKEVQDLICLIFDVESMKKAMMEFEIDLKKMPLGKLSKRQIESAYKVLSELQKLTEKSGTPTQFLDASNRFYTLIPHDFGMKKPPLLDTADIIKTKTEMLDNLLEIEVAYSMLKGGDEGEDPIDAHYKKLKCEMKPMDKSDDLYKKLVDYTANTHAATHNQYDLEVQDIFEVDREGEYNRYRPFEDLHNKQLLWHGSRVTNFAGILSQGLRIAPPEAPVTGYMFGKGIYFADMVSKSANYCRTSKNDPTGILLLCEVALGNMHELTGASYIDKLPKGKHSTKGIGMTAPDPKGTYTTPKDVVIPMGKGCNADIKYSSLLYNEFIVYDVAQVNIKYLLKMKFNYKW